MARFDSAPWSVDPQHVVVAVLPALGAAGQAITMSGRDYLIERGAADGRAESLMVSSLSEEALFAVAQQGVTHPIDLDDDEVLAMQTHVVFLPGAGINKRVVGIIRSNVTPGHIQVGNILSTITGEDLILYPLLRDDPTAMVRNSVGASRVKMTFAQDTASVFAAFGNRSEDSAEQLASMSSIAEIEMTLKIQPAGRARWRTNVLRLAERIARMDGVKPKAEVSIISSDGETEIVNLIQDELTRRVRKEIPAGEPRTLSSGTALEMVIDAYEHMITPITNSLAELQD